MRELNWKERKEALFERVKSKATDKDFLSGMGDAASIASLLLFLVASVSSLTEIVNQQQSTILFIMAFIAITLARVFDNQFWMRLARDYRKIISDYRRILDGYDQIISAQEERIEKMLTALSDQVMEHVSEKLAQEMKGTLPEEGDHDSQG